MRKFTSADIDRSSGSLPRINAKREELIDNPPDWMRAGRQETATGYGSRLNSGWSIHFDGRIRRVYVTCWSNAGTSWIKVRGEMVVVDVA